MNAISRAATPPKTLPLGSDLKRLETLPTCWHWKSESDTPAPTAWVNVTTELNAPTALLLARQNVGMVWWCDFQNAKQLLVALQKRLEPRATPQSITSTAATTATTAKQNTTTHPLAQAFHVQRLHRSEQLKILSKLLIPILADYTIALKRSPQVREVLISVWGEPCEPSNAALSVQSGEQVTVRSSTTANQAPQVLHDTAITLVSLKELLGYIGAHEWQKKGVAIPALKSTPPSGLSTSPTNPEAPRIYPHYGVFSPVRGEYLNLVGTAPLPLALEGNSVAQDVGVGTGVLSAILLSRGVQRVVGTDTQDRALECARDNLNRLGLMERVQLLKTSLFAQTRSPLIVCNPPWLPGKARSPMERAVFDPESAMLKGFLSGLQAHLSPEGEGWLIMSDLAERLGLRASGTLQGWIEQAGLVVVDQLKAAPTHPKSSDTSDPFYEARRGEITSLWRLRSRLNHTNPEK